MATLSNNLTVSLLRVELGIGVPWVGVIVVLDYAYSIHGSDQSDFTITFRHGGTLK